VTRIAQQQARIEPLNPARGGLSSWGIFGAPLKLPEDPSGQLERGFFDRTSTDQSKFIFKRNKLFYQGEKLKLLGFGSLGRVFEHPTRPEAVLKVPSHTVEADMMADITPEQSIAADAEATARLAVDGLGTYLLGCFRIQNQTVLLKERVYGDNLAELVSKRQFGPTEHGMVMDLVKRMSNAHLRIEDMRLENFMIGMTLFDPTRRAYIVDGNAIEEVDPSIPTDDLHEAILQQHVITRIRFHPYDREEMFQATTVRFAAMLQDGLDRANEKGWRKRASRFFRDILANMQMPPMK